MSLLGDIGKAFTGIVGGAAPILGGIVGGPIGAAIGTGVSALLAPRAPAAAMAQMPSLPMTSPIPSAGIITAMAGLPAVGGAVVRAGAAGARLVISSARYYCAKYPGWCIRIGGLGAVQGLLEGVQLPLHRRRRRRGIPAREFAGFRRVHNVLSGFCAPRIRVRRKGLGG